jgi:two-component system nitrate/nitrite response regulator NarL
VRILVADDHDLISETIAAFLTSEGNAEVSTASTLAEAIETVKKQGSFDLVLLDYNMPGMDGLKGLQKMIAANESRPVAILSGTSSRALAEDAINAGAAGYIPKTLASKSIVSAAHLMAAGEIFAPFNFMQQRNDATSKLLSKRELDVLKGICRGQSNKEIARDHDLHEATVKLHAKTLCRKLEAKNRTHAAMIARDRNLI